MIKVFITLSLTLLLTTTLLASHEVPDYSHELEDDRVLHLDQESLDLNSDHQRRLNLEDPVEWSASGEVMDKNHAWYRRRRSVQEDAKTPKSAVFIPPFIRNLKRVSHEECRNKTDEFLVWLRTQSVPLLNKEEMHCNDYCCYPTVPSFE